MIELKHITKSFSVDKEKKVVLSDISLSIEDGEMIAIMGASGSGKSTLLNILGCMEQPDSGTYICNHQEISNFSLRKKELFRKENIAFIFQQFALVTDMTVKENIELPLKARNVAKKERSRLVREYSEMMEISDQLKKKPALISGGQQQRCAIARALVTGNSIILADEPTGALDRKTGMEIMAFLRKLTEQGKTVIVVTHDEKVAQMADRIIYIEDGKLITGIE